MKTSTLHDLQLAHDLTGFDTIDYDGECLTIVKPDGSRSMWFVDYDMNNVVRYVTKPKEVGISQTLYPVSSGEAATFKEMLYDIGMDV